MIIASAFAGGDPLTCGLYTRSPAAMLRPLMCDALASGAT